MGFIGHLSGALGAGTRALASAISVTSTVDNPGMVALIAVGAGALLCFGIWWQFRLGRLRTHAVYRAWIPFDHRNDQGITGKHGRPVLILEELGDGTVLVLEGTSKSTGYGTRLNIGTGGWSSRRDVTIHRDTYLRTDRCLRIPRGFIEPNSGPHQLPRSLRDEVLASERPPIETRLAPPPA